MHKFYTGFLLTFLIPFQVMAKCSNDSLADKSPSKLLIYHTDKEHRLLTAINGIKYERSHDELSDMEFLYEVSHKKDLDKKCTLYLHKTAETFSLKQKEELLVKSASLINKKFTMTLDHKSLSSIVCTGVQTIGDLRDVMEPYLSFSCKENFAYNEPKQGATRLPASVSSSNKPNH